MEKSRRALPSNTAGFEKKAAGFTIKHGGLCHRTRRALKKKSAGFAIKHGGL
ncbi:hypothetical protein ABLT32_12410 [Bacteroides pyogenes]|uniref:hypothetical protein n=1 Tax=Bacteroides pyogenes TaxID=310300 RepID=UPI004063ACF1